MHEQEHILQLVAEAIGTAGLIEPGAGVDADLLAVIRMIAQTLDGMRDSAAP